MGTKDGHRRTKHGLSTQDAKMLQVVPNGNLRRLPGNPRSSLLKARMGQFGPQVRQDGPKGVPWRLKADPGKPSRPKQAPRMPNELPSDLKRHNMAPTRPKEDARGAQSGLLRAQDGSKQAQGRPKSFPTNSNMAQDGHEMAPGRAQGSQTAPRGRQGCPKTPKKLPRKPNSGQLKTLKTCMKIDSLGPRGSPSESNMAQDDPRRAWEAPRWPERRPRRPQGALKTPQIPARSLTSQKC